MSKSRAFGSQVLLQFSMDGGLLLFRVAEIDQFSAKQDDIVKENSSLGETGVGTIDALDNGGTLSFEAKKSDAGLINLFNTITKHLRALETNGTRGRAPYWTIKKTTKFTDGSGSIETFKKVVLHSPEESVADNKSEIIEKFEGRYIKKDVTPVGNGDGSVLATDSKAIVNSGLLALAQVGEQTALSYVPDA